MSRTVLVTGGTSGIGRAVAERFAADGADVVVTGRHQDTVERTAKELGVRGVVCDASDPAQAGALAEQLESLQVLVNAAGGLASAGPGGGSALDRVLAQWQAALAQNLLTAVLTTSAVQDRFTGDGCVISVGSIGAERRGGSYGAAKAALAAWNAALSADLAPRGVTCNVISAGYIAGTNFFQGGMTDERHRTLVDETHDKRPGTVDDIAATAYFLASPGARHITGQTLHVNGGAFTTR
ncbi:SDR family NAD(P)-dependent oxidoreductase [Streptomyces sp. NPDC020917]|uniref:SDR family NAD(P)-dependent oxidoreductase n=1 Tax=Streptomyces sp. NPDC020917 TaxID=3365102 RepID=UPI0037BAD170